jgi:hypothetical protein
MENLVNRHGLQEQLDDPNRKPVKAVGPDKDGCWDVVLASDDLVLVAQMLTENDAKRYVALDDCAPKMLALLEEAKAIAQFAVTKCPMGMTGECRIDDFLARIDGELEETR